MLAEIISQVEKTEALLERAATAAARVRGLRSGDRVWSPLVASAEWDQNQGSAQNLIFNVPADADYWAYRLALYPQCKVVDPVNGTPDEIVYRSTSFTGESFSTGPLSSDNFYCDFDTLVDATFAFILDGKELQNIDTPAAATYCMGVGKWGVYPQAAVSVSGWAGASQTPGGMPFDIPFFIARGKTLSLRLTPTFLAPRTIVESVTLNGSPTDITRQHRYRIVAVLEGEKKVSAFR